MKLIDDIIEEVRCFVPGKNVKIDSGDSNYSWPEAGARDIVLKSDTALELGSPQDESVSFLVWTNDPSLVNDAEISLLGPDVGEAKTGRLPFGRVILVCGDTFNETNCYDRFREMDLRRYDVSLKGYMMRAASQYMREWSRISREAVNKGFSFSLLGRALIQKLKELDYVNSVEMIFVTSSAEDVRGLKKTGERLIQYVNAMGKMTIDEDFNCEACNFQDVCDEAEELRDMHKSMVDK